MSTDTREDRLARRIAELHATDRQFAAAVPRDDISTALEQPGVRLADLMQTVLDGYAERPALGQRAVRFVEDPLTGRTSAELLPEFETITYAEVSDRVHTISNALTEVRPGDRVAILGFTSVDYTTVDMALALLGAVSVPLQTSAPSATLRPIVAETEPVVIASAIDYLADAVDLALSAPTVSTLVVFDYQRQVDDQQDALAAANDATVRGRQHHRGGHPGRGDRPRHEIPCAATARLPRSRPVDPADLHLRQYRRTQGRDVPGNPGRQFVAPVDPSELGRPGSSARRSP